MEQTLTQLPFWSSLTEQEQETLRRSAFVRHYEKGAFIHSSDNECLGMLFILSGEIRTQVGGDVEIVLPGQAREPHQRRLELNLTQPYVAEKMGVTASTILRYENGSIDRVARGIYRTIYR